MDRIGNHPREQQEDNNANDNTQDTEAQPPPTGVPSLLECPETLPSPASDGRLTSQAVDNLVKPPEEQQDASSCQLLSVWSLQAAAVKKFCFKFKECPSLDYYRNNIPMNPRKNEDLFVFLKLPVSGNDTAVLGSELVPEYKLLQPVAQLQQQMLSTGNMLHLFQLTEPDDQDLQELRPTDEQLRDAELRLLRCQGMTIYRYRLRLQSNCGTEVVETAVKDAIADSNLANSRGTAESLLNKLRKELQGKGCLQKQQWQGNLKKQQLQGKSLREYRQGKLFKPQLQVISVPYASAREPVTVSRELKKHSCKDDAALLLCVTEKFSSPAEQEAENQYFEKDMANCVNVCQLLGIRKVKKVMRRDGKQTGGVQPLERKKILDEVTAWAAALKSPPKRIWVFVSGHGCVGGVASSYHDEDPISLEELLRPLFSGELQGTTKMLFIDCCRGERENDATDVQQQRPHCGRGLALRNCSCTEDCTDACCLPQEFKNYCCLYAALPGYAAWGVTTDASDMFAAVNGALAKLDHQHSISGSEFAHLVQKILQGQTDDASATKQLPQLQYSESLSSTEYFCTAEPAQAAGAEETAMPESPAVPAIDDGTGATELETENSH